VGYVGAKSRQRWLFYAYDRIRRTVVRTYSVNARCPRWERLLGLLSAFEVVVWMTDGWPLYESRLKENCTLSASDIRSALSGITWN
jgi:insertion element IS1 protein InsB